MSTRILGVSPLCKEAGVYNITYLTSPEQVNPTETGMGLVASKPGMGDCASVRNVEEQSRMIPDVNTHARTHARAQKKKMGRE